MIRQYKKKSGIESVFASLNVRAILMSNSNLDEIKKLSCTLRRPINADNGDYVVIDEIGGFYPFKSDAFEAVYEEVR